MEARNIPGISTIRKAPALNTAEVSLSLNKDAQPLIVYDMLARNDSTSLGPEDVLHIIQSDGERVVEECVKDGDDIDTENVWRGHFKDRLYSEEEMVKRRDKIDKALLCALHQQGM